MGGDDQVTGRAVRAWLGTALLAALVSGAAFRATVTTGVPGYRMAATLLLVLTGWALAAAAESYQIGRALQELERRLAGASSGLAVLRLPPAWSRRRGWSRGYLLVGPGGVMVAAALSMAESTRRGGAARRLQRAAAGLREAVRQLKAQVQSGEQEAPHRAAPVQPDARAPARVPGYGLIVLLRRRVHRDERQRMRVLGVGLANVEHVPEVLGPLLRPPAEAVRPLQEQEWRALAAALAQRLDADVLAPAAAELGPATGALRHHQVRA